MVKLSGDQRLAEELVLVDSSGLALERLDSHTALGILGRPFRVVQAFPHLTELARTKDGQERNRTTTELVRN